MKRMIGNGRTYTALLEYGGVQLSLSYERDAHLARIGDVDVSLSGGTNVIFVDGVARHGGRSTVTAMAADLRVDSPNPDMVSILSRSSEVIAFLRCDDMGPDQKWQPMSTAFVCKDLKRTK